MNTATTTEEPLFKEFPKMPRLRREGIITEKIDGTNAQVFIRRLPSMEVMPTHTPIVAVVGDLLLYAGSRNRLLLPGKNVIRHSYNDNFGFAAWVREHAEELARLGPGRHFGEWWGAGIQRTYGLTEKRFSLFNVNRNPENPPPGCVSLVPVLYRGVFDKDCVDNTLGQLRSHGSVAAPGFMKPEGIVCFHVAAGIGFKVTLEDDESPKSLAKG